MRPFKREKYELYDGVMSGLLELGGLALCVLTFDSVKRRDREATNSHKWAQNKSRNNPLFTLNNKLYIIPTVFVTGHFDTTFWSGHCEGVAVSPKWKEMFLW